MSASRLGLGTVQFGTAYGITNARGQVPEVEVRAILATAAAARIDVLDTAAGYGESEAVLGRLRPAASPFRIITKIAGSPDGFAPAARAATTRLGRAPDAVLLHDAHTLAGPEGQDIAAALLGLRETGLTAAIGISVYSPEALGASCALLRPDLVQLPFNVFDRRFEASGWLDRLKADGVEIHARSLFLQGSLLAGQTPPRLAFAEAHFAAFRAACAAAGLSQLAACLAAGLATAADRLIIGVTSRAQLDAAIAAAAAPPALGAAFAGLASDALSLIDPSRWPQA